MRPNFLVVEKVFWGCGVWFCLVWLFWGLFDWWATQALLPAIKLLLLPEFLSGLQVKGGTLAHLHSFINACTHLFIHLCIAVDLGSSTCGQGWRPCKPSLDCQASNLVFPKLVFKFWLVESLSVGAESFLFQEGEVCWEAGWSPSHEYIWEV